MKVSINSSTPKLNAMIKALSPEDRASLNGSGARSLWVDVRAHLLNYAASHHATADRLGATRTGHFEEAASTMSWGAGRDVGYVEVQAPGIGRVFHDLEIRPIKAAALTIPIHAMAYGRRVAEVRRSHTVFRPKGTNILATTDEAGGLVPLYALCRSATVPQDREILPADEAMAKSAVRGMIARIKDAVTRSRSINP